MLFQNMMNLLSEAFEVAVAPATEEFMFNHPEIAKSNFIENKHS